MLGDPKFGILTVGVRAPAITVVYTHVLCNVNTEPLSVGWSFVQSMVLLEFDTT